MTAHPKIDPETGELHFFGYDARPPFVTYHVASADGRLLRSEPITVTGPTMMHDFGVTKNHVVWLDMPVVFDLALARKRGMPYHWSDQYPPRLGVMPKSDRSSGGSTDVRWFSVKPGYSFHVANAHEDDRGAIIVEAINYDTIAAVNYDYAGRPNRYTYAVNTPALTEKTGGRIVKYDRVTGARTDHQLDSGWVPGEQAFVPAAGARGEDEGWLLSIVAHQTADAAKFLVLDATRVDGPPVAVVELPRRVPAGFHGAWIADALS